MTNPTKGMTDEQKSAFKKALVEKYRSATALVVEAQSETAKLEANQGVVADQIVAGFGAGPHKLDGKLIKARKIGEHFVFSAVDLNNVQELDA